MPRVPVDWQVSTTLQVHGRTLTPDGPTVSVAGLKGRYRLMQHVTTPTTEWVDLIDTNPGTTRRIRSVRRERIKTVHRK